jgi:hypothetical protein
MHIDTRKIVRCLRQGLISGVIAGVATLFVASNLMGYIWHVRNGDTVVVSKWRIPVPERYWAFGAGKNGFWNLSFGAPFFHKNYGFITIHTSEPRKETPTHRRLEFAIVKVATDTGLRLQERRAIQSPSGEALCFQFATPSLPDQVEIRCVNTSGNLGLFYKGSRRFSGDIYSVVAGIQPI